MGDLVFPVIFIMLYCNEDANILIILSQAFVTISLALLDIQDGIMAHHISSEEAIFRLPQAMKHPKELDDTSYALDDMELIVYNCVLKC